MKLNIIKSKIVFYTLLLVIFFSCQNINAAKQLTGFEIMKKVDNVRNFKTSKSQALMIIENKHKQKKTRKFKVLQKKYKSSEKERSLIKFYEPANVRGVCLLNMLAENSDQKKQWVFFPSEGNVRKIIANQKKSNFMGSDFTYEDLAGRKPNDSIHKLVNTIKKKNKTFYLVKSIPKDKNSSYSSFISFVNTKTFVPELIYFYNNANKKTKVLINTNIRIIDGVYTILSSKMENIIKSSNTLLVTKQIIYNKPINDLLLSPQGLKNQ